MTWPYHTITWIDYKEKEKTTGDIKIQFLLVAFIKVRETILKCTINWIRSYCKCNLTEHLNIFYSLKRHPMLNKKGTLECESAQPSSPPATVILSLIMPAPLRVNSHWMNASITMIFSPIVFKQKMGLDIIMSITITTKIIIMTIIMIIILYLIYMANLKKKDMF